MKEQETQNNCFFVPIHLDEHAWLFPPVLSRPAFIVS